MDRVLGGHPATATMSRAHAEIAHQTRRLSQLIDDIGPGQPDEADIADLRALLYGLHAILRLHTAQEDESYLSLAEDAQAHAAAPVAGPVHRCRAPRHRPTGAALGRWPGPARPLGRWHYCGTMGYSSMRNHDPSPTAIRCYAG
jgi:hypothetical protein